jgi:hypothetical protein
MRNIAEGHYSMVKMEICVEAVDIIRLFMETVVADFMLNPQQDQDATGHTDGQARYVYKGISFVPSNVSPSDL